MRSAAVVRACLAMCLAAALAAAPTWAQNLLANPGFEGGLAPDGAPQGWVRYGGGAEGTELRLTEEALEGQSALLLLDQTDVLRDPRYSIGVAQEVRARPGGRYQVLLRARPVFRSDERAVLLRLQFLPSERDFIVPIAPKLGRGFQVVNLLALAPEDTNAARLYIYSANIARSETVIDEVSLTELSPEEYRRYAPLAPYNSNGIAEAFPIPRATVLAEGGEARATIVSAKGTEYLDLAQRLQRRLNARSGAHFPVVVDVSGVDFARRPHLIALGKMSNNEVIERLYWTKAAVVDSVWPGPGGYVVRTVTRPYAFPDAEQAIVLGGSTPADVREAVDAFVQHLEGQERLLAPNRAVAQSPQAVKDGDYPRPSTPSQALDLFIESASARVRGSPYDAWRDALLYLAECYAEDPGLSLSEEDVSRAAELFYLWQAVEGDELFSDEDRLVIANTLLAILHALPERIPGYHRLDVRPTVISPDTSRPLLGLYYGARYFWHHYGNVDERMSTYLRKCQQAFGAQYRSYKSRADVAAPQTLALRDTVEYALNENDLTIFENGMVGRWADYTSLICQPHGGAAPFGEPDQGADRLEQIALPYALWYHRDGRYLARLRELDEGYRSPYHDDVEPQAPEHEAWSAHAPMTMPMFNLRLPKPVYGGPKQQPTVNQERAFDKLALRTAGPLGQYLLIDGYGRGEGGHYDTNAIVSFMDRGVHCLLDGGEGASSTTQHSMVSVLKDGLAPDAVPPAAAVLHRADFDGMSVVQTVVRDYNGVDWYRNLFWHHGGPLVVLDALQALEEGEFQVDCDYMVNGRSSAEVQSGTLTVALDRARPGKPVDPDERIRLDFHLLAANDSGLEFAGEPVSAPGFPVRQRRQVELAEGEMVSFQNLLCTSDPDAPPAYGLHRAGERGCIISGPDDRLAYAGVRGAEMPYDDVVLGADVFYVRPDRIIAMNLAEFRWGRLIMSGKGAISIDLDLRTGIGDVVAEGAGLLRIMGQREGEVRVDGQVVPAKYHKGELLTVPIQKGRHKVEVNPWVVDESLIARIAADLEDLKAAAPQYVQRRPVGITHDITEMWSTAATVMPVGPLDVADVDGDGLAEVLLATGETVRAFAADGTELWASRAGGYIRALAPCGGGRVGPSVVVATDREVRALGAAGEVVARAKLSSFSSIWPYSTYMTAVGQAGPEEARVPQIVVTQSTGEVTWFDEALRQMRQVRLLVAPTSLATADLNGDGLQEILVGTVDGKLR
ncbi:MAG: hypothetical protein ACE5R4_13015, partial [Armatimonadota bacterium]